MAANYEKPNAGWFGKEDGASPKPRKTQQFGAIFSGLLGRRFPRLQF